MYCESGTHRPHYRLWDAVVTHWETNKRIAVFRCTQLVLYLSRPASILRTAAFPAAGRRLYAVPGIARGPAGVKLSRL